MTIKEAKQEIRNTLWAYLQKDEFGKYKIPQVRQRPLLLIGAPGIGKTAIMEQIAQEEGLVLVSYTMTHHTRQSAVGLPFIVTREFSGREYSVTEYTMSEIIASVYRRMEETGKREGILFLDEINCVSETLAPTMLQFLQAKRFGNETLPEGFLIVAAGNPPEYNKSVREFDIVTLDRVRYLEVAAEFEVWKEYALGAGILPVIVSYLELKRENFYRVEASFGDKRFVTARGWQDLSELLSSYEALELPVTQTVVGEYLRNEEVAEDFFRYYELYRKYRGLYRIREMLETGEVEETAKKLSGCAFDEKVTVLGLLEETLFADCAAACRTLAVREETVPLIRKILEDIEARQSEAAMLGGRMPDGAVGKEDAVGQTAQKAAVPCAPVEAVRRRVDEYRVRQEKREADGMLTREQATVARAAVAEMNRLCAAALASSAEGGAAFADAVRSEFRASEERRLAKAQEIGRRLDTAFAFLTAAWGKEQELVMFLTELALHPHSSRFLSEYGNQTYTDYNRAFLLADAGEDIRRGISQARDAHLL